MQLPKRWSAVGFLWLLIALRAAGAAEPKTLLLVYEGPDGHPVGTHEYAHGMTQLSKLLSAAHDLKLRSVKAEAGWSEGPALIDASDGVLLFLAEGARWIQADPRRHQALVRLAARGGGLTALHWAMGTKSAEPIGAFLQLFGGCHGGPDRKYQVLETDLHLPDPAHPIVAGLSDFRARDEFYYHLKFVEPRSSVRSVLEATIDGQAETVAWAWQRPDGGRSFGFSGLHFDDNWDRPPYAKLVGQGVLWTMKVAQP